MKLMSELKARFLLPPMEAMIRAESGWTGRREMSSFQGLSAGKTWRAARILSASGVLNITGFVMAGIFGKSRSAPRTSAAPRAREINRQPYHMARLLDTHQRRHVRSAAPGCQGETHPGERAAIRYP